MSSYLTIVLRMYFEKENYFFFQRSFFYPPIFSLERTLIEFDMSPFGKMMFKTVSHK